MHHYTRLLTPILQHFIQPVSNNMITRHQASNILCSICLNLCSDTLGRIQCSHAFCFSCIKEWAMVRHDCPNCRHPITRIYKLKVGNLKASTKKLKQIQSESIPVIEDELDWSQNIFPEFQDSIESQVVRIVSSLAQQISRITQSRRDILQRLRIYDQSVSNGSIQQ